MTSDDSAPLPLPPTPAAPGLPHLYVLNSDPEFLDMIRDVLADVHLQVTVEQLRPNLEVTLSNLRSAQPDLLLLDVVPHKRNEALGLLEALAASPDVQQMPVLLASTSPTAAEEVAQQFPGRVFDVLTKPFDIGDLYLMLNRAVDVPIP